MRAEPLRAPASPSARRLRLDSCQEKEDLEASIQLLLARILLLQIICHSSVALSAASISYKSIVDSMWTFTRAAVCLLRNGAASDARRFHIGIGAGKDAFSSSDSKSVSWPMVSVGYIWNVLCHIPSVHIPAVVTSRLSLWNSGRKAQLFGYICSRVQCFVSENEMLIFFLKLL